MSYFNNLTESIGNTPMVILNNITKNLPCSVWAKYETFNPGNSVKDRIGLNMIIEAEIKAILNLEELLLKVLLEIQGWDLPLRLSPEVINVFL